MFELLVEVFAEVAPVAVRATVALVLTALGAAVELNALSTLSHGDLVFGAWLVYLGGVALYAGVVVVGRDAVGMLRSSGEAA